MGEIAGQSLRRRPQPVADREPSEPGGQPGLWTFRPRGGASDGLAPALLASISGGDLPAGIERRLPRRAEVLWNRLRGDAALPPAEAASALLAPPFSTQALLVTRPLGQPPQIAYAGTDLGRLGRAGLGPARADARPTAPITARLVALALAAVATRAPRHLDSDFDPDTAGPQPGLLFRAVALPLAPHAGSGLAGLAVAVLSWRQLLSPEETAALHNELRAAISWLGSTSGPSARS